ncbi:protein translocase subunit SecDF [Xylanibacter brevis]|uniref:protein translocase subunit SecDF n=1 Tax=Xylanibacter brevis TaxID=83231 RepID=UPI000481C72F|nr:protein translocase subunit SecDF [Xylanibacter brevis]
MQNKGIVKFIAVALVLICCFYLSFSFVTRYHENKAAEIAAQQGEKASLEYLDSVENSKVWFWAYNLKECREMEIGLGLDLKGGMNVVLEVSVPDIVDMLADHKSDPGFRKVLNLAREEEKKTQGDFVSIFARMWEQNETRPMAAIFATQQMRDKVSTRSTNAEVVAAIRAEVQSAIDNAETVVRTRVDKFGVVQPNIQKLEGQSRIMVEMPGVKEPERVRKLLQGSANLEFWETYNAQEILPYLSKLNTDYAAELSHQTGEVADTTAQVAEAAEEAKADTAAVQNDLAAKLASGKNAADNSEAAERVKKQNPLFYYLHTERAGLAMLGDVNELDTAAVNAVIYSDIAKKDLPSDVKLLWSAKGERLGTLKGNYFQLYAIKVSDPSGKAPLSGDVITSAKDDYSRGMGTPEPIVSMQMNTEGTRIWANLTKTNIKRAIAIVLDNVVYSAPRVNDEITGGNSQISGNFTQTETKDLANTLNSGKMPAPTRIVQEQVVGPTLGAQSIQQGAISFVVAFILLMCVMVVLYGWIPGMLANMALLFNLFFTLGILTSFQAALTMPGIAGIVLTLGTAVDANVLIYERTKEELRRGLNIKEALNLGYSNAFSAIFDSNLTSLITGIILYVFGTGPIRGFATTLIIGICVSFFTAVFMTRLVYDRQMKKDKWQNLSFTTPFSKNMMQNMHVNFMGKFKASYCIWGVAALVFIASFFTRGLDQSIDFTGGRNYVVVLDKEVPVEEVRALVSNVFTEEEGKVAYTSVIALGASSEKTVRISTNWNITSNDPTIDDQAENILFETLKGAGLISQENVAAFKNPDDRNGGSIIESSKVGPSVAKTITQGAIISVALALIAIFLYILLRFRNVAFSVGSIVALALDALVVIGFYSLLHHIVPWSLEVDQTFIGAILTVIGYSINDKVVVFDRIRENMQIYAKRDRKTLFNDSLNQTLARTINTSVTTLIVLLTIFFLGGDSIRSFSFAMILGVVFGTLSSIFIAAPTAYLTMSKKDRKEEETAVAAE